MENVYLQLLSKQKSDTKHYMEKFVRQISTSLVQAYGSVTISIPEVPNMAKEELVKNHNVIERLTGAVVSFKSFSIQIFKI